MIDWNSRPTPIQSYNILIAVFPPAAWIGLSIATIALISFYIFRKQRAFPAAVLAWLCISNLVFCIHIITKWSTWSAGHQWMVLSVTSDGPACRYSVFMEQFTNTVSVACNTCIAVTMFVSIKLRKSMAYSDDPKYIWGFLAFIAAYGAGIGIAFALSPKHILGKGVCGAITLNVASASLALFELNFLVQIALTLPTLSYARKVISAATSTTYRFSAQERTMALLYFRGVAVIVVACTTLIPAHVYSFFQAVHTGKDAIPYLYMWYALAITRPLGAAFDGTVLIAANRPLWEWIHSKFSKSSGDSSDTSSGIGSSTMGTASTAEVHSVSESNASPSITPPSSQQELEAGVQLENMD